MLSFKNVQKSFGDIVALEDINLDIDKGEFVFITGPSGAGKTTILRLILRELLPDEGEIILAGEDITHLPKKHVPNLRQQIGTIFQDYKVLPERTLTENIEIALAVLGIPKNEWNDRVEHVLKLVDLSERRNLFPSQLSGGELQRASLARALVINPKLILADEPTGNLDWSTADKLMELFEKINKEGKTIVMATHHQGLIDRMNKRQIKIDQGRITSGAKSKASAKSKDEKPSRNVEKSDKKSEKRKTQDEEKDIKVEKVEVEVKEKGKN